MITEQPMTPLERRSVGALSLLYCFRMLGLFMVLPVLTLYAADLPGATPARIGLALGLYGLAQALLQVPLGWLSDRVGRKTVIVAGMGVFVLGCVIAALADSITGIIVGRTLQGAGAIAGPLMALVSDLTREEQRTKAMAIVGVSIGFSFTLALVLGPVVASFGELSTVFWFSGLLAVTGIVIVVGLVPTPAAAAPGPPQDTVRATLAHPLLLHLNFGVFVLHFILTASFLVVPSVLEQVLGIDRDRHWMVYLPVLLLSLAGMVPLMVLAERFGHLRRAFLLAIGLVSAAVVVLDIASAGPILYGALWLFFAGFNYLEATLPSLLSKTAVTSGRGAAMGVYTTCQFLGAFAGGAGGGWLLEHLGADALTGISLLLAAIWWLLAVRVPAGPLGANALPGVQ